MKYVFNTFIFFITFFLFSCSGGGKKSKNKDQNAIIDDYSNKIDSLIQITKPRIFNGVILITQNGETKYSKEYGFSNFEKKTPISLQDKFRIQSNSKQITAVLTLKEVEKGNIELYKPIKEYLPNIKQSWADSVTVHQLLNNTSGIVGIEQPLLFKEGTDFHYSNVGFGLLGRIIEKVTGTEYIELANNLFLELGMKNSYCYELDNENSLLINGYRGTNNKYNFVNINDIVTSKESWKDFIPAGGIISSAHDLNIWDEKLHNGKLLNSETYSLLTSTGLDTNFFKVFGEEKIGYGYGVCISNSSLKHIGHAGKGLGFNSFKFYIPKKKISVVILENIYDEEDNIFFFYESKIREIILNSNLCK